MRPLRTFTVVPALPAPLERLRAIAYNLRWAWDHDAIELFRRLDTNLWESSGHNPVKMLACVDQERLVAAAADDWFLAHLDRVAADFGDSARMSWFRRMHAAEAGPTVAYFSAEFGLTECLPIYSGGLGVLAGDHLKSASDLGLPLVGVGLLYQQGYFRQYLNSGRLAAGGLRRQRLSTLPASARPRDGAPLTIEVDYPGRRVRAQVWRARWAACRSTCSTPTSRNSAEDRDITDQLYGGDLEMRIRQEILLGIGGFRALRPGHRPDGLPHERGPLGVPGAGAHPAADGAPASELRRGARMAGAGHVFTTHTPVQPGTTTSRRT